MRFTTILSVFALILSVGVIQAQTNEYILDVPLSDDFFSAYTAERHSGARDVNGPFDLDGDGLLEVLVTDYSGGGRVHVVENVSADTWELVYSTPWLDSTATTGNIRAVGGGDLDGDGLGEIYFFGGEGYSDTNPNIDALPFALYGFEAQGDNDFGDLPATTFTFPDDTPNRWRQERIIIKDVDGDDIQELMFGNNGNNAHDDWYILSVTGDIGSGFEVWVIEARLNSRASAAFDPVNRGGGSPYAIHPADLDGDGSYDFSMHAWNFFNLTNGTVTGPDTYSFPDTLTENAFLQASFPDDHVSLFGGVVVDIDGNGDDEVFYPRFQTGGVTVLNYEEGEDPIEITADNVSLDVIPVLSGLGITYSDFDNDGFMELVGTGPSFSGDDVDDGEEPQYLRIVEYNGGDVESPGSYSSPEIVRIGEPFDTAGFDVVVRDSAGFVTRFHENGPQGPIFVSKLANLGDGDGDGLLELAAAFQGVDDTLEVFDETFDGDSLQGGFAVPDGANDPGPAGPGQSYIVEFDAPVGSFLSFATMFVQSNDLFFAPADTGIALWNPDGTMRSGDLTSEVLLWDAATELNEEPGVGPNQAPRQPEPNTGEADTLDGVTLCCVDGFTYPAVADVIDVTLDADEDTGVFTLTITNVSSESTLKTQVAVPLSPGVFTLHSGGVGPIFSEGGASSPGLEALAEDGNHLTLLGDLQSERGFFRTVRETFGNPVRAFLRIFSWDGVSVSTEDDRIVVPEDYKLSENYPNPFNPSTSFSFTLPIEKNVSVKIYDVQGRLVRTLVNNELRTPGTHEVTWDGRDAGGRLVASGTYMYTLEYGNFRKTQNMVLLK